jgi:hypothetical protein
LENYNIFSSGSPETLKNERCIETALVTMEKNNIEAQAPCYEGGRERKRVVNDFEGQSGKAKNN